MVDNNMKYELIDNTQSLVELTKVLSDHKIFYIDTEFVSNRNTNTLCLIQISNGEKIFLIDTIKLRDTTGLSSILCAENIQLVLHSGSQDIYHLVKYFNLKTLPKIFDTQVAFGTIGAEYYISLSYLIYSLLNLRIEKNYQQIDWTLRPLNSSHLHYAAGDVKYLPALFKILQEKLQDSNKIQLYEDIMSELALGWVDIIDQPKIISIDSFRNAWELDYIGLAALEYLIDWYNGLSLEKQKVAPKPNLLFTMAKILPSTGDELKNIQGIPYKFIKKEGDNITGRMMLATHNANSNEFEQMKPHSYKSFEEIKMSALIRMIFAKISCDLSIAPEILYNDKLLGKMIKKSLKNNNVIYSLEALKGWRSEYLEPLFSKYFKIYNFN